VRTALAFLTRLPISTPEDPSLNRAAPFFPLVGLLVGALAAATRAAAGEVLPPLPSTLLAITAAIILTGALHEDGLADVADAIGAHTTKARRLEILKDPRVGTFGALALILTVGLIASALAALDAEHAARAFIAAHVLSRAAILPVSRLLAPAKPGGAGALLRASTPATLAAVALAAAIAVAAGAAIALASAAAATLIAAVALKHTLGGITGDGYGATAKLTELAVCLTLCAWWA
jgi:adenosylcobinamide-GDP ribazoletransferase